MSILEEFLRDVVDHHMEVLQDAAGYRHLRFRQRASSNHWFDLVAWPGVLCIHGDMGTFVFSRERDMFDFFGRGKIKSSYWAEKLVAMDRGGVRRFSIARARVDAIGLLDNYDLSIECRNEVEADIHEALSGLSDYDQIAAHEALLSFESHGVRFDELDDTFGEDWRYHFLWCLHAITWGIDQYTAAGSRQ